MADDLYESLADTMRLLRAEDDVQQTLKRAIDVSLNLFEGCDGAGVVRLRADGAVVTETSSSVALTELCELPSGDDGVLQAMWHNESLYIPDLREERRWPAWAARVADGIDIASLLCFQLFVSESALCVMVFASKHPRGFDKSERTSAEVFAAHITAAIADARENETLHTAVEGRTTIGQAQGILMERFSMDPDQAFEVLKRVSQHRNVKLREVAVELIRTRKTPGVESV